MIADYDILEVRILECLESEDRWWTIEELATSFDIAKATVQKNLNHLKSRIDNFSDEEIYIESSTSKGTFLFRSPSFNVQILYTEILQELLVFSLLNSLLYSDHLTIIKLASDNFVSVASVRRKYKQVNTYFEGLDIAIKKDKVIGDERQIRWFYSELYWQIFKGVEWPFRHIPREFMENIVQSIEIFFKIELIPEVKEEMIYWMTIQSLRHMKGYRVPTDEEIEKFTINNSLFPKFIEILKKVFPNEEKRIDPKALGESQYLFLILCALPITEKNESFSYIILKAHKAGNTMMYQMSRDWLEFYMLIFGEISDEVKRNRIMNRLLRIHSYSYLYKIGSKLFFQSDYASEIIAYHPRFFSKIDKIHEELSKNYPEITKNRDYLMENYALLAMEELDIGQLERTVRVALSFSKGVLYEAVVKEKLLIHFKGKYKLNFVHYTELKEVLITDLPHVVENESCSLVSSNTQLTKRDYHNIEKAILKYV